MLIGNSGSGGGGGGGKRAVSSFPKKKVEVLSIS